MNKLKIVIRVSMKGQKSYSKALKIVVGVKGVESASLGEKDKSEIEVVGAVDPVKLTGLLRKKMEKRFLRFFLGNLVPKTDAQLLSVTPVDGSKKEEKKDKKDDPPYVNWPYGAPFVPPYFYEVRNDPNPCSIL